MRERAWELAVRDMLDACGRCLEYTAGMDQAASVEDRRTYDATIRNIEIVGEAANNVPRGCLGCSSGNSLAGHRGHEEPDHPRLWGDQ